MKRITIEKVSQIDEFSQLIEGWNLSLITEETITSVFFSSYIQNYEGCQLDHGYESATVMGRMFLDGGQY